MFADGVIVAMKVHHEGFLMSQEEALMGKTGLPHADSAIGMSNGVDDGELIPHATA